MNGHEFEKRIKKYAKARGMTSGFDAARGKGSHGRLYMGARRTTLKDRRKEIGPGLLRSMCRDLDVDPRDL